MSDEHHDLVKQKYLSRDFGDLFRTILSAAGEIGLDAALQHLECCVTEKRVSWLDANLATMVRTGDPLYDGYRIFYEVYLGVSPPQDGEIAELTDEKLVSRWWNACPVLEVCAEVGLDTRLVCRKAYEKPVQAFLSRIHPRLRFSRNYDCIRPYTSYCEEIISLECAILETRP